MCVPGSQVYRQVTGGISTHWTTWPALFWIFESEPHAPPTVAEDDPERQNHLLPSLPTVI